MENLELKVNKKIIYLVLITIILISAIIYNFLYIKNEKNEIINEFEEIEEEIKVEEAIEKKSIFVDVSGEVMTPGLYELKEGARINDAISIAGGVTSLADLTTVNLAYILQDAMKITIPKKETKKTVQKNVTLKPTVTTSITTNTSESLLELVNINTASKDELKRLEGIGDATAKKIIDYRDKNGSFKTKEDIKNVSGIGTSKYEKIKEKIVI